MNRCKDCAYCLKHEQAPRYMYFCIKVAEETVNNRKKRAEMLVAIAKGRRLDAAPFLPRVAPTAKACEDFKARRGRNNENNTDCQRFSRQCLSNNHRANPAAD